MNNNDDEKLSFSNENSNNNSQVYYPSVEEIFNLPKNDNNQSEISNMNNSNQGFNQPNQGYNVNPSNINNGVNQPEILNMNDLNQGYNQSNPGYNVNLSNMNNRVNQPGIFNMNNSNIDDNKLLKEYIGENYEKIIRKNFNFAGFFLTTIYLFYRKMFLYGILLFLASLLLINITNNFIISLFFNVLVGLFVNRVYVNFANNKIKKIKLNNPHASQGDLVKLCFEKGRTSIGQVFLGIGAEILIAIVVFVILMLIGISTLFIGLFSKGKENRENGIYDGSLSINTYIKMTDEFSINIPSKFEKEEDSSEYEYDYKYENKSGSFNACSLTMRALNDFTDANNLIDQMKNFNQSNSPSEIKTTIINNTSWNYFSYNNFYGKEYVYVTNKEGKVYLLNYKIEKNAPSDCEKYREEILNTIKAK